MTLSADLAKPKIGSRAKLRDDINANTNVGVCVAHRMASINEGEDVVALVRRNALHGVWGELNHGILCIYININIDHVTLLIVYLNQQCHVTYMLKMPATQLNMCILSLATKSFE